MVVRKEEEGDRAPLLPLAVCVPAAAAAAAEAAARTKAKKASPVRLPGVVPPTASALAVTSPPTVPTWSD